MKKVFVIIVTYKGHKWYERCFTSLRNSSYPVQTIVIDNASNDGTVEYIRENFPEIHLIESKENLGFGKANNLGMRYALDHGCDYVFLLNQDTWINVDSVSKLVEMHIKHPEYGVLSPMHITADMKSLYMQVEDGGTNYINRLFVDTYWGNLKDVYTFKYVNAAAWFMTRQTIETIGGFDPIFFLYGEDDNYLHRMEFHSVLLGVVPTIRIIHDHQKNTNNVTESYKNYRLEQLKLVEYTNILKTLSFKKCIIYLIWKYIVYLLTFNKVRLSRIEKEIIFIRKYKKKIEHSRKINTSTGLNWL